MQQISLRQTQLLDTLAAMNMFPLIDTFAVFPLIVTFQLIDTFFGNEGAGGADLPAGLERGS